VNRDLELENRAAAESYSPRPENAEARRAADRARKEAEAFAKTPPGQPRAAWEASDDAEGSHIMRAPS
jgi:hypothetical protein